MIFAKILSSFLMATVLVTFLTPSVEAWNNQPKVYVCYSLPGCKGSALGAYGRSYCASKGGQSYSVNGYCKGSCHSGGDPHFNTWSGDTYSYHGECDLVLLSNPEFRNGLGLNVHVRTEIETWYSFISNVAVQIGNDILEVTADKFYVNGVENPKLPLQLATDFKLSTRISTTNQGMIFYNIHLGDGDYITIKVYKKFLYVYVEGSDEDFLGSVGLMGDFATGQAMARDGVSLFNTKLHKEANKMGAEWQVKATEPQLFHEYRAPQLPLETCRMPEKKSIRASNINPTQQLEEMASEAVKAKIAEAAKILCADKDADEVADCIFDVIATGDLGMAAAAGDLSTLDEELDMM
jgi:von Willebrand factor type D domain/Repulsive guidance molecule (RGM) C-terminus